MPKHRTKTQDVQSVLLCLAALTAESDLPVSGHVKQYRKLMQSSLLLCSSVHEYIHRSGPACRPLRGCKGSAAVGSVACWVRLPDICGASVPMLTSAISTSQPLGAAADTVSCSEREQGVTGTSLQGSRQHGSLVAHQVGPLSLKLQSSRWPSNSFICMEPVLDLCRPGHLHRPLAVAPDEPAVQSLYLLLLLRRQRQRWRRDAVPPL